jgi:hypothetical protein
MQDIQADYYRKAGKIERDRAKSEAVFSGITGALKLGALSYFGGKSPVDAEGANRTVDNIIVRS